jgi:hypothetical protein
MQGWIKLHRKLTEKGYYKKSQYVHLWVHLLLKANHKPNEFMWNGETIIIKEGQLLTGRKELQKETGISESTLERILQMLENEHQIKQQKTNKFRIITVINWKNYQIEKLEEKQGGQQADIKRTTSGHQTDTNNNDNKEKNDGLPEQPLYKHDIKQSPYKNFEIFKKEADEDTEIKAINPDLQFYHSYCVSTYSANNRLSNNFFYEIKRYIIQESKGTHFHKSKTSNILEFPEYAN